MKKLSLLLLVLFFSAISISSTFAGTIIFGIDDDNHRFKSFDLGTSETNEFGSGIPEEIENLTGVGGGIYYGIQSGNSRNYQSSLYKFTVTGNTTDGFSVSYDLMGSSFDYNNIDSMDSDGTSLYAIANNRNQNKATSLIKLDFAGNVISNTDVLSADGVKDKFEGMAYNEGSLYLSYTHWSEEKRDTSDLFKMNRDGSGLTLLGTIGYGQVEALTFIDGILYGASDRADKLFTVNFDTNGMFSGTTEIADWGNDIEGMASNSVPIPGAVWLLGSGLLGMIGVRRRKKG